MKNILRIAGILIASGMALIPVIIALADPGDIQDMTANPSDTAIILTWVKATSSDNTVIRYSTDNYPATISSNFSAYNGTGFQATVGNLTAGQAYYFSAWGYQASSGNYSATPYHLVMSTLAMAIPSGAQDSVPSSFQLPTPTVNAQMNQSPDASSFQLEPFTSIVNYFVTAPGGLGMPVNNVWEVIAILGIVGGGFMTYVKIRNFFVAFAVVFIITLFAIGIHMVQGWLLGVEIIVGAGVWGVEHYLQ